MPSGLKLVHPPLMRLVKALITTYQTIISVSARAAYARMQTEEMR